MNERRKREVLVSKVVDLKHFPTTTEQDLILCSVSRLYFDLL